MTTQYPVIPQPFALAGDRTVIQSGAQVDGTVSFNQGWTGDYQLDPATNPTAKNIDRAQTNYLMYALSGQSFQRQRQSAPEFISSADNGGAPVAYPKGAFVVWRATSGDPWRTYMSTIDNNIDQFPNTSWLDVTAMMGNKRGVTIISGVSSYAMTVQNIGEMIQCFGTTACAVTLPAGANLIPGAKVAFWSNATVPFTVYPQGSNTISNGQSFPSSITINAGDTLELVYRGGGIWMVTGGSLQLGSSFAFGNSIAANGWQRLPSGLILQWGGVSGFSSYTITFPLAFPVGPLALFGVNNGTAGTIPCTMAYISNAQCGLYLSSTGSAYWMAIGR